MGSKSTPASKPSTPLAIESSAACSPRSKRRIPSAVSPIHAAPGRAAPACASNDAASPARPISSSALPIAIADRLSCLQQQTLHRLLPNPVRAPNREVVERGIEHHANCAIWLPGVAIAAIRQLEPGAHRVVFPDPRRRQRTRLVQLGGGL